MLVALAGGVGAARLLRGLIDVMDPAGITAVVNTGDDIVLHGLHISPDLDTVTYTLAGAVDPDQGWGLAGETWATMGALERYGGHTWFRLGDRDMATHLFRTQRLTEHAKLSDVTAAVARAWGVGVRLLPMSDDRVETRVTIAGPVPGTSVEIGFQEWFVGRRHGVSVESVRFLGADEARPAPGVLEAIETAEDLVVCPSNPIVSIGPLLAVPGIEDALAARREEVLAVSPIVAGRTLKGPADQMMTDLGHEASVVGVARLYAPLVGTLVIDHADAGLASAVEAEGVRAVVAPSVMTGPAEAAALARVVLACNR
ncbi:MAG TPA: 2-phospho-L-lactate transferase [Acidimicrobiales bacterium]|nr:2-phospho-L-lactate transferase [Acidimicrobiales bacterium]